MPARVFFTTRIGGVSRPPYDDYNLADHVGDDPHAVAANRRRLLDESGAGRLEFMHQVHGADVCHVGGRSAAGVVPHVDALVTTEVRVGLVVLVADCVPVLLGGDHVVAAVHAGRRGLAAGVVTAAVAALRAADPGPFRATVGPSVCGGCYEVPQVMQDEVSALVPLTRSTTYKGSPGLDLRAGVVATLRADGIDDVVVHGGCTVEDSRLFSHRRDGVTGRFAGVIVLEPS